MQGKTTELQNEPVFIKVLFVELVMVYLVETIDHFQYTCLFTGLSLALAFYSILIAWYLL